MSAEQNHDDCDVHEGGVFSVVGAFLGTVTRAEWIVRTAAGFLLAAIFFVMPFSEIGGGEPWYCWVASGVVAFVVGTLMSWLLVWVWKEL
jgi:hypothetical protein